MKEFSILKSQFSTSGGFTIIEVLASLAVVIVVGSIIGSVIFSSSGGAAKSNVLNTVRQNGNYALSQWEKTARNSTGLVSPCITPTPSASSIAFINSDSTVTTFSCVTASGASNGIFEGQAASVNVTPAPIPFIDQNNVAVTSCNFSCSQGGVGSYPSVVFSFTLSQKASTSFFEQQTSLPFETSVTLRNQVK
jgi:type II secretory pathway pseudopilin PulG